MLPSLSVEFGVLPQHIDDMTPREVGQYLDDLAEIRRQQKEAARGR